MFQYSISRGDFMFCLYFPAIFGIAIPRFIAGGIRFLAISKSYRVTPYMCAECGESNAYRPIVHENEQQGFWCPNCHKAVEIKVEHKINEGTPGTGIQDNVTEGEESGILRCPTCGTTDLQRAYIENGGIGDWCPNCMMSLQKMRHEI
jgi:uncharacterized protein YlaI